MTTAINVSETSHWFGTRPSKSQVYSNPKYNSNNT